MQCVVKPSDRERPHSCFRGAAFFAKYLGDHTGAALRLFFIL